VGIRLTLRCPLEGGRYMNLSNVNSHADSKPNFPSPLNVAAEAITQEAHGWNRFVCPA
jgi:hypothetical protein